MFDSPGQRTSDLRVNEYALVRGGYSRRRDRHSGNVGTPRTHPQQKKTGRLLSRSDNPSNASDGRCAFGGTPDMGRCIVPIIMPPTRFRPAIINP